VYLFFERHKILRTLLDYAIFLGVVIIIFYLFEGVDLSTAWFIPIFLDISIGCLFFYVNRIHEPKKDRMNWVQWLDNMRWINGIGLVFHTTIGYYTKYSFKQVVKPIWNQKKEVILITIVIYLMGIIIPSFIIHLERKHRK